LLFRRYDQLPWQRSPPDSGLAGGIGLYICGETQNRTFVQPDAINCIGCVAQKSMTNWQKATTCGQGRWHKSAGAATKKSHHKDTKICTSKNIARCLIPPSQACRRRHATMASWHGRPGHAKL